MIDVTQHGLPILPKTTFVVGVGNKARHGKDSTAEMLVKLFTGIGVSAKHYAFAEALYGDCRVNLGMQAKNAPLLQKRGVEVRERDPFTWVRTCFWRIADEMPSVAVVSDCRFLNEVGAVREQGGLVARVRRYNADGSPFVDPSRPADHPSEVDLDGYDFDADLVNDGTLDDLYVKVLGLAEQVAHRRLLRLRA